MPLVVQARDRIVEHDRRGGSLQRSFREEVGKGERFLLTLRENGAQTMTGRQHFSSRWLSFFSWKVELHVWRSEFEALLAEPLFEVLVEETLTRRLRHFG